MMLSTWILYTIIKSYSITALGLGKEGNPVCFSEIVGD